MLSLEQQIIFDRYKHPQFSQPIGDPTIVVDGENPSCGDEVKFSLKIERGVIVAISHATRGCAICTASADILAEHLINSPLSSVGDLNQEGITEELGIPLSPTRLKCALLPLEVLQKTVNTPLPD
jgi:nitrogen fixation NifU-like protein